MAKKATEDSVTRSSASRATDLVEDKATELPRPSVAKAVSSRAAEKASVQNVSAPDQVLKPDRQGVVHVPDYPPGLDDEVGERQEPAVNPTPYKGRRVRVKFFNQEGIGKAGSSPVFLGHNGRGYWVPRDKVVELPEVLLRSVLKDAVTTSVEYDEDLKEYVSRDYSRYNYQILGPA